MQAKKDEVFIKVSARVRPFHEREDFSDEFAVKVSGYNEKPYLRMLTSTYFKNSLGNYYFEHVYSEHSPQSLVFDECARELCDSFFEGKNCNIVVYGPTSTGKTYTMQGDIHS